MRTELVADSNLSITYNEDGSIASFTTSAGVVVLAPVGVKTDSATGLVSVSSAGVSPFAQNSTETAATPVAPNMQSVTVTNTESSASIFVGSVGKTTYNGTAELTGHAVGALGYFVMDASDQTAALAIGSEGKIDVLSGTVTTACAAENQIASNAGAITTGILCDNQLVTNTGTIGLLVGSRKTVSANSGTITTWYGDYHPDLSAVLPGTTRRSYINDDPGAPMVSKAAIVDASQHAYSPTTGEKIALAATCTYHIMIPAETLDALTLTFPAAPIDGQELLIKSTQIITSLTLSGNGETILDTITTIAALGSVRYKYLGSNNLWYKI